MYVVQGLAVCRLTVAIWTALLQLVVVCCQLSDRPSVDDLIVAFFFSFFTVLAPQSLNSSNPKELLVGIRPHLLHQGLHRVVPDAWLVQK